MKRLSCLFLLLLGRAAAQNPGAGIIAQAKEDIRYIEQDGTGKVILQAEDQFRYIIYRNPDGSKTFLFSVYQCPEFGNLALVNLTADPCLPLSRSEALSLEPVQEAIGDFLKKPGVEAGIFGLILVLVILLEPLGMYGRWMKIRLFFSTFPMYKRHTFRRQKSYMKSERLR